jgi:valyl-tRNA synthetase
MKNKYNHLEVEKGLDQLYQDKKVFSKHDLNKKPFSIIMPPPNVTGKLHLGHA